MSAAHVSSLLFGAAPVQSGFAFPQSLTEKYRPATIAEFAGLDKPKRILSKLAANPFESAWLFVGPSGTGKTTMALALASMIPAELHHIPSQECNLESIERIRRTTQYVPRAGCKVHLVLIDEANRMSYPAQMSLLSKLDSTNFFPNTIVICTCNTTDGLEQPLLSRHRVIDFSSYGISSDATALLARVWSEEAGSTPGPNFARIVKDSANNVREALMRLETEIMAA